MHLHLPWSPPAAATAAAAAALVCGPAFIMYGNLGQYKWFRDFHGRGFQLGCGRKSACHFFFGGGERIPDTQIAGSIYSSDLSARSNSSHTLKATNTCTVSSTRFHFLRQLQRNSQIPLQLSVPLQLQIPI